MLIKEELRAISLLPVPQRKTEAYREQYLTSVDLVELRRSGIVLVADVYHADNGKLAARFFSDGKGYCTCNSWPDGSFGKANPARSYWGTLRSYSYEADTELAEQFLHRSRKESWRAEGALAVIDAFISDCQTERRNRAEESRTDLQRFHFSLYPNMPENMEEYCENNVFPYNYIFFDKLTKSGRRYARCGNCGKKYRVTKDVKRNQETVCPHCGRTSLYKAAWNPGKTEDKARICVTHRMGGFLLIRWADVIRRYSSSFERKYTFSDYAYNLYIEDKYGKPTLYAYEYRPVPYYETHEWKRCRNGWQNFSSTYVYTDNLDAVFGENYFNVNLKQGLQGKRMQICFTSLLNSLEKYPVAEYLFKLNMPLLAANAGSVTRGKGKHGFSEVLGVSKQFLPMYSSMCVSVAEHQVIKKYGKWVSPEELQEYRKLNVKSYDAYEVEELLKTMSFGKFVRYFGKQKASNKKTIRFLMTQYRDYISMAKSLKIDLERKSNLFPKDICLAHDTVLEEFNRLKFEKENEAFKRAIAKIYPKLTVTEWENEKFCIVLPKLRTDLTTEGQSLHHCVGGEGYCKKHMKGERMIFFVRLKTKRDKPYFTMEVDMERIRIIQLHGMGNCSAPKDVREFAESFIRKLKPITKETKRRETA